MNKLHLVEGLRFFFVVVVVLFVKYKKNSYPIEMKHLFYVFCTNHIFFIY